jgi:hypothetical protein
MWQQLGPGSRACRPSSSAPAAAPATQAPATPSLTAQVATWVAGSGYTEMKAVESDTTTTIGTDASNQDVSAVESDGSTLATDAQAAALDPPPIDSAEYTAAMTYYATAGNDASNGDFTDATTAMNNGTALINKVAAAVTNS